MNSFMHVFFMPVKLYWMICTLPCIKWGGNSELSCPDEAYKLEWGEENGLVSFGGNVGASYSGHWVILIVEGD